MTLFEKASALPEVDASVELLTTIRQVDKITASFRELRFSFKQAAHPIADPNGTDHCDCVVTGR